MKKNSNLNQYRRVELEAIILSLAMLLECGNEKKAFKRIRQERNILRQNGIIGQELLPELIETSQPPAEAKPMPKICYWPKCICGKNAPCV